ncbi:DUF4190 domain-containing protein [Cohnella nanjingensis]|uniref:DUF4190 domain-containing protein n=1 Tax=Cohnella nanjingensis TaxID=1387779 RepID=A0A7X0RNI1_9BACL|nr:DUF4190 domain-containing protein [Cohnella nanjingensis]MBB6670543.1 DUF4190 domain-containing protein [Cohnella nanjingensis]
MEPYHDEPSSSKNAFSPMYPPPPPPPARTNGKSIAALVLGILSIPVPYLGFIIGILAIVFAALSLKEIKRTGELGRGMAIAGLVCGIVGTALYTIVFILIVLAVAIFSNSTDFNVDTFTSLNA